VTAPLASVTFVVAKATFAEHNVAFRRDNVTFRRDNMTFLGENVRFVLLEGSAMVEGATRVSHEAALVETGVALCRAAVAPLGRDEAFGAAVMSSYSLNRQGPDFL
jgi:hypothetical protein